MLSKVTIVATLASGFLLAAISDSGWAAIGIAVAGLIGLGKAYIALRDKIVENQAEADKRADARAVAADARLEEVQREARERAKEQDTKLNSVAASVKQVEVHTNSLTEKLGVSIEKEARLRGEVEERARALAEKSAIDAGVQAAGAVASTTPSKIPAKVAEQIVENKENADDMVKHLKDKQKQ